MAMRVNPLLLTITTAGFDKTKPCFDLRTVCTEIIAGMKQDDSLFSIIYSLDEEDDWSDDMTWIKSNPNLDITVNSSFIQKQVIQAKNNPSDEVGIKTKNLNMWCDVAGPVDWNTANNLWNERTQDGARATKFADIDYYDIFEADTRMFYSDAGYQDRGEVPPR